MEVFKKRYRFIQVFNRDMEADPMLHVGLYRICEADEYTVFTQALRPSILLPHYGFSLYENPPGRIIRKGKGDVPTVFQSWRLMNLGLNSLLKYVPSIDMFTDDGLSTYRHLSVMMLAGVGSEFADDLRLLSHTSKTLDASLPTVLPDHLFAGEDYGKIEKLKEEIRDNTALYDEVFHLKHGEGCGYFDFLYLTAGTLTSFILSHKTIQNIIQTKGKPLKTIPQALIPGQDKKYLHGLYGYDETRVNHLKWNENNFDLFGILPGMFGFEGAVFDVATGLVTGKRQSLVRFLLLLNGLNLLAERDLRYLA